VQESFTRVLNDFRTTQIEALLNPDADRIKCNNPAIQMEFMLDNLRAVINIDVVKITECDISLNCCHGR